MNQPSTRQDRARNEVKENAEAGKYTCILHGSNEKANGAHTYVFSYQGVHADVTEEGIHFGPALYYRGDLSSRAAGSIPNMVVGGLVTLAGTSTYKQLVPWADIKLCQRITAKDNTLIYDKTVFSASQFFMLSFYNREKARDEWIGFFVLTIDGKELESFAARLAQHNVFPQEVRDEKIDTILHNDQFICVTEQSGLVFDDAYSYVSTANGPQAFFLKPTDRALAIGPMGFYQKDLHAYMPGGPKARSLKAAMLRNGFSTTRTQALWVLWEDVLDVRRDVLPDLKIVYQNETYDASEHFVLLFNNQAKNRKEWIGFSLLDVEGKALACLIQNLNSHDCALH